MSAADPDTTTYPKIELGALFGPLSRTELTQAVSAVRRGEGSVLLTIKGIAIAAVIPPEDLHEPGECCCKNCPWGGKHEGATEAP